MLYRKPARKPRRRSIRTLERCDRCGRLSSEIYPVHDRAGDELFVCAVCLSDVLLEAEEG